MNQKKKDKDLPIGLKNMLKHSILRTEPARSPRDIMITKFTKQQRYIIYFSENSLKHKENTTSTPVMQLKKCISLKSSVTPKFLHLADEKSAIYIRSLIRPVNMLLPKIRSPNREADTQNSFNNKQSLDKNDCIKESNKNATRTFLKKTKFKISKPAPVHKSLENKIVLREGSVPEFVRNIYSNITKYNLTPIETKVNLEMFVHDSQVFIIGGLGALFNIDLTIYKQKSDKVEIIKNPVFSRTHYAIVSCDNHVIIHGGETELSYNSRQILNSIIYINACNSDFHEIKFKGFELPYKKAHVIFILGVELFMDGGLNFDDSLSDSLYVFNLVDKKARIVKFVHNVEYFSNHRCITINASNNWTTLSDVLTLSTLGIASRHTRLDKNFQSTVLSTEIHLGNAREVVYVFGGLDYKRASTNNILFYQQKNNHLVVEYPKVTGAPPLSRYDHSMVYVKEISSIVIIGGKHRTNEGTELILGDLWLFETTKAMWIKLTMELEARSGFAMCVDKSDILIFGGFGSENLIDGKIRKIEIKRDCIREFIEYFAS